MNQHFDCIIIGAGISGVTAAIYLKRSNYKVALIESNVFGGQANKTSRIENFPGFTYIDGPSFVMNLYDQVKNLEIPIIYEVVNNVEKNNNFNIITNKNTYESSGIIIATGRIPKMLGLKNEQQLIGKGISYCALCDGMFYKDKEVCVVGGGNSALEESLYLSDICKKVTILNRSDKLRATQILKEKVEERNNIEILYNNEVKEIIEEENKLSKIITTTGEIKCEGLFIYIGSTPNIEYLSNLDIKVDNNYIVVDENMKTTEKFVYACGDTIKKDVYQLVTAASEGAIAATSFGKDFKV